MKKLKRLRVYSITHTTEKGEYAALLPGLFWSRNKVGRIRALSIVVAWLRWGVGFRIVRLRPMKNSEVNW